MKRRHEERVELVTSLTVDKQSHVLLYGANIGQHNALVSWKKATQAMSPHRYPAEKPAFEFASTIPLPGRRPYPQKRLLNQILGSTFFPHNADDVSADRRAVSCKKRIKCGGILFADAFDERLI